MADLLGGGNEAFDIDRAASAFPDISLDGNDDFDFAKVGGSTTGAAPMDFEFDSFMSPGLPAAATQVKVTGDDEIDKFESEFPDIEVPAAVPPPLPPQASFRAPTFAPKPQIASTPILSQPIPEDEPEVIREWRERQAEEIRKRDEASKRRQQDTKSSAEQDIDEFYEEYAKKKERNIRENKEQEEEYLQKLQDSLSTGTTWDRICELVDLQNSQSKTLARTGPGTTDLARFKEVLLRLRREGEAAPGAGGY